MSKDRIVAIVFAVVLFVLLCRGGRDIYRQNNVIKTYDRIEAKMTKFEFKKLANDYWAGQNYEPIVEYEYEVNNKKHTGHKIWPLWGICQISEDARDEFRSLYAVGNTVEILYCNDVPSESYLFNYPKFRPYASLFVFSIPFCIAIWYVAMDDKNPYSRFWKGLVLDVFLISVGLCSCLHYFSLPGSQSSVTLVVGLIIYFSFVAISTYWTISGRIKLAFNGIEESQENAE